MLIVIIEKRTIFYQPNIRFLRRRMHQASRIDSRKGRVITNESRDQSPSTKNRSHGTQCSELCKNPYLSSDALHVGQHELLQTKNPFSESKDPHDLKLASKVSDESMASLVQHDIPEGNSPLQGIPTFNKDSTTNARYKDVFSLVSVLEEPGHREEMWSDCNVMSSMLQYTHIVGK